jgi:hypothetical protein
MDAVTTDLTTQPPKRSHKVLVAVLTFVLAVAVFGAVFVYAGGMDLVKPLLGGSPSAPAGGQPAASAPATRTATTSTGAAELEVATLAYAEQIESQTNISLLASGGIKSFAVEKLDVQPSVALVTITAQFRDGTSAQGALRFVKSGETWYFTMITGLRGTETGGLADSVRKGSAIPAAESTEEKVVIAGVGTPDQGVLDTIITQQKLNQAAIRALLAGKYKNCELGKPVAGPSTFTIPITMSSPGESPVKASIVLVAKTVGGKDRIFIASFKRE